MDHLDTLGYAARLVNGLRTNLPDSIWHQFDVSNLEFEVPNSGDAVIQIQRQHLIRKMLNHFKEYLLIGLEQAGSMFGYSSLKDMQAARDAGELRPYMTYLFEESLDELDRFAGQQFDTDSRDKCEKLKSLISLAQQSLNLPLDPNYDPAINLVGSVESLIAGCSQEILVREKIQTRWFDGCFRPNYSFEEWSASDLEAA